MSSMSHNNGVVIKFGNEHVLESMESLLDVNDDGAGALNLAFHPINPLVPLKIYFVTKSCVTSVMNPSFKSMVTKP
jgi:hypothetical protein